MVIMTRAGMPRARVDALRERIERRGLRTHVVYRDTRTVVACAGDASGADVDAWRADPDVESVASWSRPYRLVSRDAAGSSHTTPIRIGSAPDAVVGGAALVMIAGPCSVERLDLLRDAACGVRRGGATALRGGAFKPRTSPYAFQGMGVEGLELLAQVRRETGLPVVTEVMDTRHVDVVAEYADVLQVGARNMQNYALLAELGRIGRPVLLKRGLAAPISEFLLAAEHIMARGNADVILCERGIRTFETSTRFTLDIAAIPVLRRETHLPVIVDPSHAAGDAALVPALSFAAIAAGADGLMVEVHAQPELSKSDREQALTLTEFDALMRAATPIAAAIGRRMPAARPAQMMPAAHGAI
ncbi:MAG: 3-deoxy-7-phosphoheptulonate synthase [Gemmatimonadetes bacterium]|nr:3-deoxy-7-phosphoheptulonate synthase [Gemmatimonadota bacterium]